MSTPTTTVAPLGASPSPPDINPTQGAPAVAPAAVRELSAEGKQEIRIAAVLNGGVSLAVWMSGVSLELHHLALTSAGIDNWRPYSDVLELLGATARIDVIAGTSAGGLNGAFLALALTHRRDLTLLRDLWTTTASLESLLRAGNVKNPPSLLQGDSYFLPAVENALTQCVSADNPDLSTSGAGDPIELILTGTLWTGREAPFTDDMGVGITERDYDATFHFSRADAATDQAGNLDRIERGPNCVIPQLASAARCTSSFPGAFEPHLVKVDGGGSGQFSWPSTAGQANFELTQYVIDGGVLLNKPIRPALAAVYKQTGDRQVRRILTYIVPDPGQPSAATETAADKQVAAVGKTPVAGDVLLSVMTRLRSTDSVSRELAEVRDQNATVRERRRIRSRLSAAMTEAGGLSDALWEGYQDERTRSAVATISSLIAAGQKPGSEAWSDREISGSLTRYAGVRGQNLSFVPSGALTEALAQTGEDWHWGQTTTARLGDMTVDLLKRAVWLAPVDEKLQKEVVACRREVATVLDRIRADRRGLNSFWATSAARIPGRQAVVSDSLTGKPGTNQPASNLGDLDAWLAKLVPEWDNVASLDAPASGSSAAPTGGARRKALYGQALELADILFTRRTQIFAILTEPNTLVDTGSEGANELQALYDWLLKDAGTATDVLNQMLRLDVVHVATDGAVAQVEQAVELVQVSCSQPDSITGMQIHHFGAFYRAPWRVNDWIEGRLDGAKQVVRFLLSAERLRQLGYALTPEEQEALLERLHVMAVPRGDHPDHAFLQQRWKRYEDEYRREVALIGRDDAPATALDNIADGLAMPLRLQALRDDLPALAVAIRNEGTDMMASSRVWLDAYDDSVKKSPAPAPGAAETATMSADRLWELRKGMREIGRQRMADDVGSDTFARTVSQAATVTAGAFGSPPKIGKMKAVHMTMSALRGYTAMVWTMVSYLTTGSKFGTRIVGLAVAGGAALLAVAILVPGAPLALTLTGVLLVLAGATAAGLLTKGARWFAARIAAAGLLVAAALAYLIWRDITVHGWAKAAVLPTLIKGGVGLVIVLLGSYIAQARPGRKETIGILVVISAAIVAAFVFHPWTG